MIALLAMQASAESTGPANAASVGRVTDPAGEVIFPNKEGLEKAIKLLDEGKNISYQGGTGPVTFDKNGDVSAPAVAWAFDESGTKEVKYFTPDEVNAFIATLEK